MLVAILYVVSSYEKLAGHYSFDLQEPLGSVLAGLPQYLLFAAFALAFAIKVPMFPFHTWLPDAHVQAPTGGSVILAAVLLKLGIYGFIRFAMPLFPVASQAIGPVLAGLGVFGIIYGAYAAWVQRDLKKLVAYSSVSHMGFILLGLFAMNRNGISGAILQMINHGISTGALFLLVGVIYDRRHSRMLDDFGGLAKVMPWYTLFFVIITLSSIGLPGTNGFVGEFMILAGSFFSRSSIGFGTSWFIMTLLATTGVIFAAVYMLHAVLRIFWGKVVHTENESLTDLNRREVASLLPLIVMVFWIGLYPKFFLDKMNPSVDAFVTDFTVRYYEGRRTGEPRLVDFDELKQSFEAPAASRWHGRPTRRRSDECPHGSVATTAARRSGARHHAGRRVQRRAHGARLVTAASLFVVAGLAGVMLVGEVPAAPELVTRYLAVDRLGLFFDVVICVGAGLSALLAGGYLREHGSSAASSTSSSSSPPSAPWCSPAPSTC